MVVFDIALSENVWYQKGFFFGNIQKKVTDNPMRSKLLINCVQKRGTNGIIPKMLGLIQVFDSIPN